MITFLTKALLHSGSPLHLANSIAEFGARPSLHGHSIIHSYLDTLLRLVVGLAELDCTCVRELWMKTWLVQEKVCRGDHVYSWYSIQEVNEYLVGDVTKHSVVHVMKAGGSTHPTTTLSRCHFKFMFWTCSTSLLYVTLVLNELNPRVVFIWVKVARMWRRGWCLLTKWCLSWSKQDENGQTFLSPQFWNNLE